MGAGARAQGAARPARAGHRVRALPLGRGFLTGESTTPDDIPEGDFRRHNPRFQGEFTRNLQLVERVKELAGDKGRTPAQLALAWLLAQG